MAESPSLSEDRPLVLGRDRELAILEAYLDRGNPAVVGLVGPAGSGKTTFLLELEARSRSRGWRTARGDERGDLTVGSATTPDEFYARIRELLERRGDSSRVEAPRDAGPASGLTASQAFVRGMQDLRRALILVDDFRPSQRFAEWFTADFVPELRRAMTPVVVVLAGLPGATEVVRGLDESIVLGLLEERAVRAHLGSLLGAVTPPVTPDELQTYVEVALSSPPELAALSRLLGILPTAPADSAANPVPTTSPSP